MDGAPAECLVLLLMKGHPGSGKSTVALEIARRCCWPLVDKDDARDPLELLADRRVALSEAAVKALNEASYDIMFRVTARQLLCGLSTVVDCPLARPQLYVLAKALAAQYEAKLAVVECLPSDDEVWRQRLEARGRSLKQSERHKPCTWADLEALRKRYKCCDAWPATATDLEHHLVLDTTSSATPAELAERAVRWMSSRGLRRLP